MGVRCQTGFGDVERSEEWSGTNLLCAASSHPIVSGHRLQWWVQGSQVNSALLCRHRDGNLGGRRSEDNRGKI